MKLVHKRSRKGGFKLRLRGIVHIKAWSERVPGRVGLRPLKGWKRACVCVCVRSHDQIRYEQVSYVTCWASAARAARFIHGFNLIHKQQLKHNKLTLDQFASALLWVMSSGSLNLWWPHSPVILLLWGRKYSAPYCSKVLMPRWRYSATSKVLQDHWCLHVWVAFGWSKRF